MTVKARRVAVIGAGPAGAIAVDALVKEQAFETVRVFDRRSAIGGTWNYTPHLPPKVPSLRDLLNNTADEAPPIPDLLPAVTPISETVNSHQIRFSDTAIHENLHSNITPEIMSYTQEPFSDKLSERTLAEYGSPAPFRHHTLIRDWVEGIFLRGGHDKLLELNTTVERAVKEKDEWVLTLRKEASGNNYWWRERFDALVVASGHYNVPWFPDIPGLAEYDERFPGRVLHSKHFRNAPSFAGKRVIVVGGSVSSHEVLHEVLAFAQAPVYASLRGEPVPAFGLEPFTHPHIALKKQITKIDADTGRFHFVDGSHVDNVDHVIFGTGYQFSMPFLPEIQKRIRNAHRRLPGVYEHVFDIEDPTLVFIGMSAGGFTFRAYEWQAVAAARHLAGRAKKKALPAPAEQLEWERKRVAARGEGKNFYSIAPNFEEYFEFLREVAGDPVPGSTGRVLPPFDKKWLDIWTGMVATKIKGWQRKRERAEKQEEEKKEREKGGDKSLLVKARL